MKIYIIDPIMTTKHVEAKVFNDMVCQQLSEYGVEYLLVNSKNILRIQHNIINESIVLVYNTHGLSADEHKDVVAFLEKVCEKNIRIWPIAIDREVRTPLEIISNKQSYDVWEQLRCRNLGEEYIGTIAKIFSRKIIADVFPTCYRESGEIFLSHRRIDGEEITARVYDKIIIQAREAKPFRDVVNVKVGDAAQEVIDEEMENSDVFVFFHTHQAAKSDWILKELRFALLRNIPILWIQIDDADVDELRIKPSDNPHLKYNMEELLDDEKLPHIVEDILQFAFELILERSNQILNYVDTVEKVFGERVSVIDKDKMLYLVTVERKGYHYPQRNIMQYYQLFGRTPTIEDAKLLRNELQDKEKDSMTILSNRVVSYSVREDVVFDSVQDFYYHWSKYIDSDKNRGRDMEIVISGAYPECDEIFKQSLTDALVLFAKAIIKNGYELTFGSHPTFQELFFDIAKEIAPQDYKNKVNMYISEWFLENDTEKEADYISKCTLHKVKKEENLSLSLRKMRMNMIQRNCVKALICLGGKIKENKEDEGIREEISLARELGIPVFVVGSVGGCSAKVAMEYKVEGWEKLNDAPMQLNEKFLEDINYFEMAQEMIRFIDVDAL